MGLMWQTSVVVIVLPLSLLAAVAPMQAWADCRAPIRSPGDSPSSVAEKLIDTVQCLNERVQLLERQLETERTRNTVATDQCHGSHGIAKPVMPRDELLVVRSRRGLWSRVSVVEHRLVAKRSDR